MKAFLLPGNLHFTLTLGPLGLQRQRNHLEAWPVRLGGHGVQQADPAGQGETGLSMYRATRVQLGAGEQRTWPESQFFHLL